MLKVSMNRHRWKDWIDDRRVCKVLENAAEGLAWAWNVDNKKSPETFPVNTWYQFVQIEEQLENKPIVRKGIKVPPPPPPPKKLSDLLDDATIKSAYEDQNEGSYEDALTAARGGFDAGYRAMRKILRAMDVAYVTSYHGLDHAPRPRVHFLHRSLLGIVDSQHLCDLTQAGIVEFFDDVCPCGVKHRPDAIRKLRKRRERLSKPKA
jgi:hypothetical protein